MSFVFQGPGIVASIWGVIIFKEIKVSITELIHTSKSTFNQKKH